MRVTSVQANILRYLVINHEIEDYDVASVTSHALLKKGLIEQCPRLYFGPRSLRYRLTELGKQWVKDHE